MSPHPLSATANSLWPPNVLGLGTLSYNVLAPAEKNLAANSLGGFWDPKLKLAQPIALLAICVNGFLFSNQSITHAKPCLRAMKCCEKYLAQAWEVAWNLWLKKYIFHTLKGCATPVSANGRLQTSSTGSSCRFKSGKLIVKNNGHGDLHHYVSSSSFRPSM